MQLVETPNNSQAIIQEGKTRMTITQSSASGGDYAPQSNCGFFNFSDTSKKTIRLMGEVNSGSMGLIADRSASIGQRDIHFTVENITFSQSRPTLTGDQVITKGVTNPKLVSASVSATGTVSNDKGDFINGNCTNANPRVCTFNSIFSSAPNCVTSSIDGGNYSAYHNGSLTSSSISVTTNNTTSGALSSVAFTLICHGE